MSDAAIADICSTICVLALFALIAFGLWITEKGNDNGE